MVGAGDVLAGELVDAQRQALGQAPVVDEHQRRGVRPDQRDQLRVDRRPDRSGRARRRRARTRCRPPGRGGRRRRAPPCRRPARSPRSPSGVRVPASAIVTGRTTPPASWPPRKRAISDKRPLGRREADALQPPPRARSRAASSRSSESARCAPRLVAAIAWISSTITVRTPSSTDRAREVSIRNRLSGVVISTSGGWRRIRARSRWGVSPVRTATLISGAARPARAAASREPGKRPLEVALDVVVEGFQRRDIEHPRRGLSRQARGHDAVERPQERRQRLARARSGRAAACASPEAIAGQPARWASVGAAKARANHSAVSAWKTSRAGSAAMSGW